VLRDVYREEHVQKADVNRVLRLPAGFQRHDDGTWSLATDPGSFEGAAPIDPRSSAGVSESLDTSRLWEEVLRLDHWQSKLAYLPDAERLVVRRRQPTQIQSGGPRRQLPLSYVARTLALDPERPLRLSDIKQLEVRGLRRIVALAGETQGGSNG